MTGMDRVLPAPGDTFEHAPCGLLMTTVQGLFVRANATFCQWVGHSADELVGKMRLQDLLTIGGKVFHQTHWAPLLQMQRSVAEVKLDVVHRTGNIVPMLINACRRHYDGVEYDEFAVLVVADRHKYERELLRARQNAELALDAKRMAQQALQLADRRKDEFLATLAHELRNPLAPMRTVIELLRLKDFTDPQVLWSRDVLERQVEHITHLVDDLLEVSRVTEGKLELRKERVELAVSMRQALENSRALIDACSLSLQVSLPDHPILLHADPIRLAQIVQNLLNNAAKYTPAGGTIWVNVAREGEQAVISIRDSGIGIASEHLPSIFEKFSQLAPALERSQGGLGIGLSLVRALTELHGGTVSAQSAGVGRGSEFVVRLPMLREQAPAPGPAVRGQLVRHGARLRILIVDDNEDAALSLAMLLELEGHLTRSALDGRTGLLLDEEFHADVVILDIGLPELNGYEIARLVRSKPDGSAKLLIALTGWGQAQDKRNAEAAGFDCHFTKPVDVERLMAVLDQRQAAKVL
jgi:PAS domain S-box-containing protein